MGYISKDSLNQLLLDCSFINNKFIISSFYITQTQKPSISNLNSTTTTTTDATTKIYGEFSFIKNFNNENSKVITISGIQQFNELIEKSKTTAKIIADNLTIYFTKAANQLMVDDFKLVTLEYIEINKAIIIK
ncbi:hypothetical protein ACTA71_005079 [Dictyostelium dimigraforme]